MPALRTLSSKVHAPEGETTGSLGAHVPCGSKGPLPLNPSPAPRRRLWPEVSLPRPQGQGSVRGSRRTHKSPRLHLVVGEMGYSFFYLKAEGGTPGTEAGGSRRAGAGFPAAAKGRSGVRVSGSAPARPQRPRQASPSPARSPPSLGSPAGETAGSSELSPPALPCQTQGVPAADRAGPIVSRAASVPKLRDGGRPVSASLRRAPPALLPENKGSPGPWCCLPPGVRVLPRFPGDVGSSQGQPAAR